LISAWLQASAICLVTPVRSLGPAEGNSPAVNYEQLHEPVGSEASNPSTG
jgi:hypothetical protein